MMITIRIIQTMPSGMGIRPVSVFTMRRKTFRNSAPGSAPSGQVPEKPPVRIDPMPRQNIMVARVMIKGGTSSLATPKPLMKPMNTPMAMVITMAAHSGHP